jgi:hypothetical protein
MAELRAYKGNRTHGTEGTHLGYWDNDSKCLVILCGLPTDNPLGCRCMPWWPVPDTVTTCRECYDKGKAMHDASR